MKRLTIFALIVFSPNLFAQALTPYEAWGETAVSYLMTRQEKIDWAAVKTDAEAKAFIEVFWARRDPTPDTPENELRQQIEKRIAEADKRFAASKTPGSQMDQGLVYTLLGEPSEVASRTTRPQPVTSFSMSGFQRPVNVTKWIYHSHAAERVAGTKAFDIAFVFQDEKSPNEYELDGPSRQSFDATALVVAKSVLKRPFLAAADDRTIALRMIVVSDRTTANDVLRRAQEGEDFAALARKFSSHHTAQQGGYIGRMAFADLDEDMRAALAGKPAGTTVLITRNPHFAIVRILSDAEAAAAEAATH